MLSLIDDWLHHFDGVADHRGGVEEFLVELNLALGHAGNVQQVVDEVGEGSDLPRGDVPAPFEVFLRARETGDFDGVLDRRERVPEFVGEHRQELVLPAVGVGKLGRILFSPGPCLLGILAEPLAFRFKPLPLGDVHDGQEN